MKNLIMVFMAIAAVVILTPTLATAECTISGHITMTDSDNPLGDYCYTLDVTWDMDSPHGLSHFNLLVDGGVGTCVCDDFAQNIFFDEIAGTSDGEGGCEVEYTAELSCDGDPSIDMGGIIFKFEPIEVGCEPGPTGSGSFVFYSDLPGVPVDEEIFGLVDKAAQEHCFGTLTGVFPAMECNPVSNEKLPWDSLKGLYR